MCTRTDGKKVIPYFFPLLSSPLLHSFPSEKWKKEAAFDGQMFYFSFIIIDVGVQYNYVVMVVCAFPNAFFLFLNLNTESADRTRGFSKHWKIANNLTLRRSCWGKNRKSTSNSTRKYTSKAFFMANGKSSGFYLRIHSSVKELKKKPKEKVNEEVIEIMFLQPQIGSH